MSQSTNFHLAKDNILELTQYLLKQGWLHEKETITGATIPGAGNMNYTLRIHTSQRTFIIKQARPYVEKYPQVPAPTERAKIEAQFYELTQQNPELRAFTPQLLGQDEVNHILVLEDLGQSNDFTSIYQKGNHIESEEMNSLMAYLGTLHQHFHTDKVELSIENHQMRALNCEHIFNYPLMEDNGFDLDTILPGLQKIAMRYKTDQKLKARAQELSKYYTENGTTLLHGDYYPGSWLRTQSGVKVIDPEFCFFGVAEFDVSVTIAHMKMAQQKESIVQHIESSYPSYDALDQALLRGLVGIEIIRRIIGLAQLPLDMTLEEREHLLEKAYGMVV